MRQMKRNRVTFGAMMLALLALVSSASAMKDAGHRPPQSPGAGGPMPTPAPITIDQIMHDVGNIRTTVDNMGYIGGYRYYSLPSGEGPRNSGHDYIGELKYWMGGVTPTGDTLVDNTWDEFQGLTSLVSGTEDYKIFLSTDTSRYFQYDRADTVGLGRGNPALGWRVWNPDTSDYLYTRNYNPQDSTYYLGGPQALQVSNFRFGDAAGGTAHMGLEVTHTMLQWNYCYNEDFTFVLLEITNKSTVDYHDFAFGLYVDLDIGGPDGTGENGRLDDIVQYDTTENLAWNIERDGYDPGRGASVTAGIMGTKLLETPDNIGMTGLRTGEWEQVPTDQPIDDIPRYDLLTAPGYDAPIPPADQYYIQCTRGIDLPVGKTIRVVYALIAGEDEADFRANAARAQSLYDKNYVGPQPPVTPTVTIRPGNRKAYLSWNDTAETSVDPLSGTQDFAGYKLYRSSDMGKTWGKVNYKTNNSCMTTDYFPVTTFRVDAPGDPIPRSYIDTGLYNDVEYWYCLSAFDNGDSTVPVDVLQSGFGNPGVSANIVRVIPSPDPAGFFPAAATVEHNYTGASEPSEGTVYPIIFSQDSLQGSDYQVTFSDTYRRAYWYLINTTTGDTLLTQQRRYTDAPELYEITEGIRVVVRDGERIPRAYYQTQLSGSDTTLDVGEFLGESIPWLTGDPNYTYGNSHMRPSFELRYSTDSTVAPSVLEYWIGGAPCTIPFEVWNLETNIRVSATVYDVNEDALWTPDEPIAIVDYPYDPAQDLTSLAFPYYYGWIFNFDPDTYAPAAGDVYTIEGAPLNGPNDNFTFKIDGISASAATVDLKKIKVSPDPLYVRYSAMAERIDGYSTLAFHNLPDKCTIRIYTLAGDLVKTIEHVDGTGTEFWHLMSSNEQQVASGIYLYHIDSPYGEKLGRFAVIK